MATEPSSERTLNQVHGRQLSWHDARKRLEEPEFGRTYWLSTIRPDGRPHVMPLIGLWQDDAMYFITGPRTRKGRNLAADGRSVLTAHSPTLPSVDLVLDGDAGRVTDEDELRAVADGYRSKLNWPVEVKDGRFDGPNAPSAGPPPYDLYRFRPRIAFGLPGLAGTDETTNADRINPVRWEF